MPDGVGQHEADEVQGLTREVERLRSRFPAYPVRYLYILMAVAAVEAADRTILSTVMEDVKHTFHVSDTDLGLLTSAYAVVAALSVIPFGILVDKVKRTRLITFGLIPWTVAMMWTGAATSFVMMFVARMFLGSVEATAGPTTPSLLGDYYPVERRSRLYGVFGIGSLVGALLGFAVAGLLSSLFGWRSAFYVWGSMGMVMALVVHLTLPEPARGLPDALHGLTQKLQRLTHGDAEPTDKDVADVEAAANTAATAAGSLAAEAASLTAEHDAGTPLPTATEAGGAAAVDIDIDAVPQIDYRKLSNKDATRELLHVPTLWIIYIAGAFGELLMSGLAIWSPTFFRRYHGFGAAGAGGITALLAVSMVAGIVIGGRLGDKYITTGRASQRVMLAGWAHLGVAGCLIPAFGLGSMLFAAPLFVGAGFFLGLPQAPLSAIGLDILVPHLRGRAQALRSLLRVGATAVAPLLFGYLSDTFSLRAAFMIIAPSMAISGFVTFLAAKTYVPDMDDAQRKAHMQYRLEEGELTLAAAVADGTLIASTTSTVEAERAPEPEPEKV